MKNKKVIGLSLLSVAILSGCVSKQPTVEAPQKMSFSQKIESRAFDNTPQAKLEIQKPIRLQKRFGVASWYGDKFQGKKTASGEIFDMNKFTAAHRTLPFNTRVRVTDMVSNKSVIVRINDRGPFVGDRIIDLSRAAAQSLGLTHRGTTDVRLDIIGGVNASASLPKGEGCADGKCVATTIPSPHNTQDDAPAFNHFKTQTIASVKRTSTTVSKDPYFRPVESTVEYDYSASPFARDHIEVAQGDLYGSRLPDMTAISSKISVQVGAFRKHAGATVYAKRYSLLTDQYSVKIKKEFKDAQPIYRVQIQGFGTEHEAKRFIRQYGIEGAFLVRR